MRVLVIGASRGIGKETLSALREYGHSAIGLARSPQPQALPALRPDGWIAGDARDGEVVTQALAGVDAVVLTLGIGHDQLFQRVSLFSAVTRAAIGAMKQRGVRRLIAVTGFGAGRSRPAIPLWQRLPFEALFGRAYRDKDVQEGLIMDSGLDWTIVRPGVLTNGRRTGAYEVIAEVAAWRNGIISRKDVAAFIAQQVADPTFIGRDVVLVG